MKIAMELSVLVEKVILPDGFEFEDFGGGNKIMPVPDKDGGSKFLEGFALKLLKGDKSKLIEIITLRGNKNQVSVFLEDFAREIDMAIHEMSPITDDDVKRAVEVLRKGL